jgi:RHS repeat-associated protein
MRWPPPWVGGYVPESQGEAARVVAPTLPKGGGAIRGIDESFQTSPSTGTASLSVPLPISPGRAGFSPSLALSYSSGVGNGPFGLGWNLDLPAISRKVDQRLPRYDDGRRSDIFVLSGYDDLVPVLVEGDDGWTHDSTPRDGFDVDRYRPRIEGPFARIERWVRQADGDTHWRVITRDSLTSLYGASAESRITDPEDPSRVFSWLVSATYDALGNAMVYEYAAEDSERILESSRGAVGAKAHERNRTESSRSANRYLKRVRYGNRVPNRDLSGSATDPAALTQWMFSLVFDFGDGHIVEADDVDGQQFVSAREEPAQPVTWPARLDAFSTYRPGFELRTYRLCRRVLMFHHFPDELGREECLVRSMSFSYDENPTASKLKSVTEHGHVWKPTPASPDRYSSRALPTIEFEHSMVPDAQAIAAFPLEQIEGAPRDQAEAAILDPTTLWVDLDGGGISGLLNEHDGAWLFFRNTSPANIRDGSAELSRSVARFDPPVVVGARPARSVTRERGQFMDLAGDGQVDLAFLDQPVPGFYERTAAGWAPFRAFESLPTAALSGEDVRWIDLDGDGLSDLLILDDDAFTWYAALGEAGFGSGERRAHTVDEEAGPRLLRSDEQQAVFVADMSGDGLADLVRVRNGDVCYWPNLGFGRFGAKVTMDDAPIFDQPDLFDPGRIMLGDLDGSGTTDIVYAGSAPPAIYFNHSGNSWADAVSLPQFPPVDRPADLRVVDLLGSGTACLVWSSSRADQAGSATRYVDLMGGQSPHLLVRKTNGMGAETRLEYAPSTRFSEIDRAAGRPWITQLPFPVQVVERVVSRDLVADNLFVTRFAYHHGHYDGAEREFRGFGMVERFDTEEFATLTKSGHLAANVDDASHVPPVLTRTWFHTGAYLEGVDVSRYFAGLRDTADVGEYYREPAQRNDDEAAAALLLPDTVLPPGLTPAEQREACRALKGARLREEVYALDGSGTQQYPLGHPYLISEHNHTVLGLQPADDSGHAVMFTHPREEVSYAYERAPGDPRITHDMTLEIDPRNGLPRKELAIAYGRRATVRVVEDNGDIHEIPNPGLLELDAADRDVQMTTYITWMDTRYTNAIDDPDDYRAPMPAESTMWELTGFTSAGEHERFTIEQFSDDAFAALIDADEIGHEQVPDTSRQQRRLVERSRTLYRADDLTGFASLGTVGRLAVIGQTYRLALTPEIVEDAFSRERPGHPTEHLLSAPGSILEGVGGDDGGFVEMDGAWWIPSSRVFFDPAVDPQDPASTASDERATARAHFFVPRLSVDPFGQRTEVAYDGPADALEPRYDLFVVRSIDAVGNVVLAEHDYRVLRPALITDSNRNRTAVLHDALGLVVATAMMGKPAEDLGDLLDGLEPDLPLASIQSFLADPVTNARELLGLATERLVYDVDRFSRAGQPAVSVMLSRERHLHQEDGTPSRIRVRLSSSDGFGREIQVKTQAESGRAPQRAQPTALPSGDVRPGPLVRDGDGELAYALTQPRWVGSSRVVFNNKGKPVRRYEPFFSSTHLYESEADLTQTGVSPVLFYDPIERVVATLHPNHTYEKVIFAAWKQATFDANDTVAPRGAQTGDPRNDPDVALVARYFAGQDADWETWHQQRIAGQLGDAEQAAAEQTEVHADTPSVAHLDSLGRPFATIGNNRLLSSGTEIEDVHRVTVVWDIKGLQRAVLDDGNRLVASYRYDVDGRRLRQLSIDAGERWFLDDVTAQPIRTWDSRGFVRRLTYDALRRPTGTFVTDAGVQRQVERIVYGEAEGDGKNLREHVSQVFDGAGVLTHERYDFRGNLAVTQRELLDEYDHEVDWSAAPVAAAGSFQHRWNFDAMNRPMSITSPDGSIYRATYNEAGLVEAINVRLRGASEATPFVTDIDYDVRGRRKRIAYANGAVTTFEYDPLTFLLDHQVTTRPATPDARAAQLFADVAIVQDLRYTYDPSGNPTRIVDAALKTVFHGGRDVAPVSTFVYDAFYRLVQATGREHIGQTQLDLNPPAGNRRDYPFTSAHPNDMQALRVFTQHFDYSSGGNITAIRHVADGGGWSRHYTYAVSPYQQGVIGNRVSRTTIANGAMTAEDYSYDDAQGKDAHGCITGINDMALQWDFKDRLVAANLGGGGTAFFRYDAAGQRLRKVIESQAGVRRRERIWIGGFEVYREFGGNGVDVQVERESLHVMAAEERVALVETQTITGGNATPDSEPLQRFQVVNHLGSASVELDSDGALITLEEYHPYGTTSLQAGRNATELNLKRYRYTGKERDEETGLSYHGARYCSVWLGRWSSPDPQGVVEGTDVYAYARCNPVVYVDRPGTDTLRPVRTGNYRTLLRESIEKVEQKSITEAELDRRLPHYLNSPASSLLRALPSDPVVSAFQSAVAFRGRTWTKLDGFAPPGWEASGGDPAACFQLACAGANMTVKPGESATGGGGVILYEKTKQRIKTDKSASDLALEQIRRHIDAGRAVVTGVSEPGHGGVVNAKTQPVTDHFVAVYGYELNPDGHIVALYAKDNAVNKTADIEFKVAADGSITKPAEPLWPDSHDYLRQVYQVSEVRFHTGFEYTGDLRPTNDAGDSMFWPTPKPPPNPHPLKKHVTEQR